MRNALLGLLLLAGFAVVLVLVTTRRSARQAPGPGDGASGGVGLLSLPADRLDEILRECNRGVALIDRHEFTAAVEVWRKIVEAAPRWPTGWVNLGIALLNKQKVEEECERALRRAIELDPKNPHAHYTLSRLFDYQSRVQEEIAELREVALIDPKDADTHYALGMALRKKASGQDLPDMEKERLEEEARRELEKAVSLNPSHHSAWYVLFQARQRSPDREKAMEALDRFRALDKAGTGDKRSTVYTEMGRYAEVVRFLEAPPVARPALEIELAEADPTSLPFAPQGGTAGPLRIDGTYGDRADFLQRGASRFGSG
ncbi:MAG TPA: tetratricopeptide repeat protein, partial [Planctomycetota bacterium]|nr:tetratricopeptide repeat protein [Planctomycetota bacterium]